MFVENAYINRYLFAALESTPVLLNHFVTGITDDEADYRHDPARFSIREAIAHLTEWESIFLQRMRRISQEEMPELPGYDEGQFAIDHNYAALDVAEQLGLFIERRRETISFLKERPSSDWSRRGNRPEIGIVTLEEMAVLIPLHDSYHTKQIVEWREGYAVR